MGLVLQVLWRTVGVVALAWIRFPVKRGQQIIDHNIELENAINDQMRRFTHKCKASIYNGACPSSNAAMLFTPTSMATGACSPLGCVYLNASFDSLVLLVSEKR